MVAVEKGVSRAILLSWTSTVILIAMGSIVRVTGYGLGCPDWPLCYGRAIPPFFMGAWVEFLHRLLGALVVIFVGWTFLLIRKSYKYDHYVMMGNYFLVGLLLVQIVLGGIHVLLEIPPITGVIHTATAMLIVGLLAFIGARTANVKLPPLMFRDFYLVNLVVMLTYILLLSGSLVTRTGASLICPEFPWCGSFLPKWNYLMKIQMLHRIIAFIVLFLTIWLVWKIVKSRFLVRLGYTVVIVLVIQFCLGIANIYMKIPMTLRVLHITVGAIFWSSVIVLATFIYLATGRNKS